MKQFFIYSSIALIGYTVSAYAVPTYGRCSFELNPYNKTDHKILLSINGAVKNSPKYPYTNICSRHTVQYAGSTSPGLPVESTKTYTCSLAWEYDPAIAAQPSNPNFLQGFTGYSKEYHIDQNLQENEGHHILNALKKDEVETFEGKIFPSTMYTFRAWDGAYAASEITYPPCKKGEKPRQEKFLLGAIFRIIPIKTGSSGWKITVTTSAMTTSTAATEIKQTYPVRCTLDSTSEDSDDEYDTHDPGRTGEDADSVLVHAECPND